LFPGLCAQVFILQATKAGRGGLGTRLGASGIITVYEVDMNAVT